MEDLLYDQPELPYNREILREFDALVDSARATQKIDPSPIEYGDETKSLPVVQGIEFTAEDLKEVDHTLYPSGLTADDLFSIVKEIEILGRIGAGGNYSPKSSPIRITCSEDTLWIEHIHPDPLTDIYMLAISRIHSIGSGEAYFEARISEHRASAQGSIEECNVLYLTEMGGIKIFGNQTSSDEYIIARAVKLEAVAREIGKTLEKFRKR